MSYSYPTYPGAAADRCGRAPSHHRAEEGAGVHAVGPHAPEDAFEEQQIRVQGSVHPQQHDPLRPGLGGSLGRLPRGLAASPRALPAGFQNISLNRTKAGY